jgi:hypothetical protein
LNACGSTLDGKRINSVDPDDSHAFPTACVVGSFACANAGCSAA